MGKKNQQSHHFDRSRYRVSPGNKVKLSEFPTTAGDEFKNRKDAETALSEDAANLAAAQEIIWATARHAVLIILQGMDAAGKDGTIKHVMSACNPQGCDVQSFRAPNEEELRHHFLWRPTRYLPGRGRIGIFNRSYYEEVLIVRVHPQFLEAQGLPPRQSDHSIWEQRFDDINAFEHMLDRNGTIVLKFYLHLSREEQKSRFIKRLNDPEKHWKFNAGDIRERQYWDKYREAYEEMLTKTSTRWAPWHIVPADDKWFTRACIADIIAARIEELDLSYPELKPEQRAELEAARKELEVE